MPHIFNFRAPTCCKDIHTTYARGVELMDHEKLIFATSILSQGFKFTELVTMNKVDWMFL